MIYVYYHENCADGTGAAIAMKAKFGDKAQYRAINYNWGFVLPYDATDVYFVDFCPNTTIIKTINETIPDGVRVIVLDHHPPVQLRLLHIEEHVAGRNVKDSYPWLHYYINQDMSGSMIAASYDPDYMSGTTEDVQEWDDLSIRLVTNMASYRIQRPTVVTAIDVFYNYLDIYDRWDYSEPERKHAADAIHHVLQLNRFALCDLDSAYEMVMSLTTDKLDVMLNEGMAVSNYINTMIDGLMTYAYKSNIQDAVGQTIHLAVVHTPPKVAPFLGERYLSQFDTPAITVSITHNFLKDGYGLSLRANKHATVRTVAQALKENGIAVTGGGHERASGSVINDASRLPVNVLIAQIENIIRHLIIK